MLMGILCRVWRCCVRGGCEREQRTEQEAGPAAPDVATSRPAPEEPSPARAAEVAPRKDEGLPADDLTAIRGIGITTQNRLNAAGILTYAQLANASPEAVRETLGAAGRGAKVQDWIKQARRLATIE